MTGFPIEFELPHEGVKIGRHRSYELKAEIVVDGEALYRVRHQDGGRRWLPNCPEADRPIVESVFPVR